MPELKDHDEDQADIHRAWLAHPLTQKLMRRLGVAAQHYQMLILQKVVNGDVDPLVLKQAGGALQSVQLVQEAMKDGSI